MKRGEHYSTALKNLGLIAFLNFEFQKRIPRSRPYSLISKQLDYPVTVRPKTSDLSVFYQILVLDEYRCVSELKRPKLIVDLGANVGYSSAYFLSRFKECSVIAVEPEPSNFAILQKNIAQYGDRATAIQGAVWPNKENLSLLHRGQGHEWGVTILPSPSGMVRGITMSEIIALSGQDRISLLKVDIEGAEDPLFSEAKEWIHKVDNIVIELHGDRASKTFFSAVEESRFAISTCDELTVCIGN
jgi:FkbM family methyltransferase